MSSRTAALADLLRQQLIRVGRPEVAVILGADERTVLLTDADGRWQGPLPLAYGRLAACEPAEGGAQFWGCFA
jgi:hypothetical protein